MDNKDIVSLVFEYLTPTDWICTSLVCKKWWKGIRKFMQQRKVGFFTTLQREILLYGIDIKKEKHQFCIRPMYYLNGKDVGCLGNILNHLCARHRIQSLYSAEICRKCLTKPSSNLCYGPRCNSMDCRDYMYVLRDGISVKVPAYKCNYPHCNKHTDALDGRCYLHALAMIDNTEVKEVEKFQCVAYTQYGTRCSNKISNRIAKCHHHVSSPLNFL